MERRMLARDISFFSLRLRARLDIATETNMSYVEHQKGFDFKRKHYGEGSCQLFKKDETFLQIFLVVARLMIIK